MVPGVTPKISESRAASRRSASPERGFMNETLAGKIAFVTGASRGIGRAIALKLAGAGANVVICASGADALKAVAAECEKLGGKAVANANSVAEMAGGASIVKSAIDAFGRIDLLVRGWPRGVSVELTGPTRETPKRVVLHLPESRPWLNPQRSLTLSRRPSQKVRWDFPAVVEKYRSSMSAEERRKWESLGL